MSFPTSPKSFVLIGVILAALGGGAWGVAHYSSSAPAETGPAIPDEYSIEKIKAAMKEDPKARDEKMREFWERKDLTDEQREKIGDNLRQVMEEEMDARINEYYAATTDEERNAILDRQIDEMEQRRKEMEARREQEEKDAQKQMDEQEREKRREERREEWRKREASKTQQQRKSDFESRYPDKRAQRRAYFRAVQSRMAARGIQGGGFGGRGFGGWGGGRGGPGGGGRRGPGG